MVDVDMNTTPPKVIGRETCLQVKGPYGLSKDLGSKHLKEGGPKEIIDFMKMENGSVH
jgi:hypothetical protein